MIKYSLRWAYLGLVVVLVLSFIASPIQPIKTVYGQEGSSVSDEGASTSDSRASDQTNLASSENQKDNSLLDETQSEDSDAKEQENDQSKNAEDNQNKKDEESLEPLTDPEPLEIEFQASTVKQKVPDTDIVTGALVYQYPLHLPKGRHGATPSLGLSYNSQNTEDGGIAGFGWSLDIPAIERKNINGLNVLYERRDFSSSLDGDLKFLGGTTIENYGAKIDNGGYNKYSYEDNTWTVRTKSGTKLIFGDIASARISDPVQDNNIYRWYLTKIIDNNANEIHYTYQKIDGLVYPETINYTVSGSDPGIFRVEFGLEDRPDNFRTAKYGYLLTTTKRLQKIETFFGEALLGRYELQFDSHSINQRSQLSSLEFTGYANNQSISSGATKFRYESIAATNLLTKIIQNTGGTTSVSYKSSAQYQSENGELLNPNLPFNLYVVDNITNDDKNGLVWDNSFEYAGGWYYYNGPMDRRFVGFEKVMRTDAAGNTLTSFYHQGNGTNSNYGEVGDDWSKQGKLYKHQARNSAGDLFAEVIHGWDYLRLADSENIEGRAFVNLAQSVKRSFDGNSSHKDNAVSFTYDSETGNLLSSIDWGEVESDNLGNFSDVGGDKSVTTYTYAVPQDPEFEITSAVTSSVVTNQANQKVAETKHYYDQLPFGEVAFGNVTKEEVWIDGSNYSVSSRAYDSRGLVITSTDPRNNVTSYQYDEFGLYPTVVINPLEHSVAYEYDYHYAQPSVVTDANGAISKNTYDGLGRIIKVELSNPQDTENLFVQKETEYAFRESEEETFGQIITEKSYLGDYSESAPIYRKVVTYADGFDRPIQVRNQVEPENRNAPERYSVTDTVYNSIGHIAKLSLPYFSELDNLTNPTEETSLWTSYHYDTLYRIVSEQNIVGEIIFEFDDWSVLVTDPANNQKRLVKDSKDQLVGVDEILSSETFHTSYEYDVLGNLTKITDALGNERNFIYDGRGLRVFAEDLHDPNDSEFGEWSYAYDGAGNLTSTLTPNGDEIVSAFDELNRVTSTGLFGQQPEITYEYDDCENGIGKLCHALRGDVQTVYEYNLIGQTITEQKKIDSANYLTRYNYDRQGNLIHLTYPDESEVFYDFGLDNQVKEVKRKEASSVEVVAVLSSVTYHSTGAIEKIVYASGAELENIYDPDELYRLARKTITLNQNENEVVAHDISYTYDQIGNILTISDQSDLVSMHQGFSYDELYRLTNITVLDDLIIDSQDFEYDALGNMTYNSKVGSYQYEGNVLPGSYANPHAVTKINELNNNSIDIEYDRNGNLISYGRDWDYSWSFDNRVIEIEESGYVPTILSYSYDHAGSRAKVRGDTAHRDITNEYYSQVPGGDATKHILAAGQSVAKIKIELLGPVVSELFSDHLGSIILSAGETGEVREQVAYWPFGEIFKQSLEEGVDPEKRKYIGKELDEDTGLSYLEARYYNASIGRFLSQDPVFLAIGDGEQVKSLTGSELQGVLSDPQALNSYAYARNNPLLLIDPGGQWFSRAISKIESKTGIGNKLDNSRLYNWLVNNPKKGGALIGVGAGAVIAGASIISGGAVACGALCGSLAPAITTVSSPASNPRTQQTVSTVYDTAVRNVLARRLSPNPNIAPRADIIKNFDFWANTSFGSKTESMIYHLVRHPEGGNLDALTRNAHSVWNNYVSNQTGLIHSVTNVGLRNGEVGIKIKMLDGTGGIFTNAGKIVTSFYD